MGSLFVLVECIESLWGYVVVGMWLSVCMFVGGGFGDVIGKIWVSVGLYVSEIKGCIGGDVLGVWGLVVFWIGWWYVLWRVFGIVRSVGSVGRVVGFVFVGSGGVGLWVIMW